jgi:hypothetical protein
MGEKRETVADTFSAEQRAEVQRMIDSASRSAAMSAIEAYKALSIDPRAGKSPDELMAEALTSIRYQKPHPQTDVECVSLETGATFTAIVVASRPYPEGRVCRIDGYAHPDGIDRHVKDGGLVPDGIELRNRANGEESQDLKNWRWRTFWQADLLRYIGRPLPVWVRKDATAEQITESLKNRSPVPLQREAAAAAQPSPFTREISAGGTMTASGRAAALLQNT